MSDSASSKKRKEKDKRKKKAMFEALQQEEYRNERTHLVVSQHVEEEEETFSVKPADGDREPLVGTQGDDSADSGSGLCSKLVFVLLLVGLAVSVGVIFFELGSNRNDLSNPLTDRYVHEENVHEPHIDEAKEETAAVEDLADEEEHIEPTFLEDEQEILSEDSAAVEEEVNEARVHQVESEPESVPIQEVEETLAEEPSQQAEPEALETEEAATSPVEESREESPSEVVEEPAAQDVVEPTNESYTTRAEREAVQEALEQVWIMSARCVEELRAFQTLAKNPQSFDVVDDVTQRLSPLRDELNALVALSSQNLFDGLLEKVSALENKLLGILADLEKARETEAESIQEQLEDVEQGDEVAAAIEEEEAEIIADEPEPFEISEETPQAAEVPVKTTEEPVQVVEEPVQTVDEPVQTVDEPVQAVEEPREAAEEAEPELVAPATVEVVDPEVLEISDEVQQAEPIKEAAEPVPEAADQGQAAVEETVIDEEPKEEQTESKQPQAELPAAAEDQPVLEAAPESTKNNVASSEEEPTVIEEELAEQPVAEARMEIAQSDEKPVVSEEKPAQEPVNDASQNAEIQSEERPVLQETQESQANEEVPSPVQNKEEEKLRVQVEEAEALIDQSPERALHQFDSILEHHPNSGLTLYGRAKALDKLAENERSNSRLEQTILAYRSVIDLEQSVDDQLYRKAGEKCIEKMKFRGFTGKAIRIQQRLISRFPDDLALRNELAVSYLLIGQHMASKEVLEEVLSRWPNSGHAKVLYGFILKAILQENEAGARYLAHGIASGESEAMHGRFFFHLGDALSRLGRPEEAREVYIDAEKRGIFLSRDQRSLYNVDRLTGRPWWTKQQTTHADQLNFLESHWQEIRDEGVALLKLTKPEGFVDEAENLKETGDWKQFELFGRGRRSEKNCLQAPKTCALLEKFPAATQCKRGQIKFSIMHPATHVWAHTGPTNCRLRAHLGLVVPDGVSLRVGNETRQWEEGKIMIFDDSFDHEVWHNGSSYRLVLIIDFWHPELTEQEKKTLPPI